MINNRNFALISLIALGIATRFIPHAPNFTAVGAVALFGGAMFRNSYKAFLIPLVILFFSDLLLNNVVYAQYYDSFQIIPSFAYFTYSGFLLTVLIGHVFTRGFKIMPLIGAGALSTIVFYLITNFGSWLGNPLYPQNAAGLVESYVAGLPFLLNQALGTALYGAILFSAAWFWIGSGQKAALATK